MNRGVILCRMCNSLVEGGTQEAHDHAVDAHREVYLADPASLVFETVVAR